MVQKFTDNIFDDWCALCSMPPIIPVLQTSCHGHGAYIKLPGNPAIAWAFGAYVTPLSRGKGYGRALHKQRLEEAKRDGIRSMMCSVNSKNTVQLRLLSSFGWSHISSVRSFNMESTIEIWQIILE